MRVSFLLVLLSVLPASANHIVMREGPFGGIVLSLAPDPLDADVLYLASFGGGIYRSADGGRRWTRVSEGLDDLTVFTLAVDPVSPRRIYAGTDSGLFVSLDAGQRWARVGGTLDDRNVRSLVIAPRRPTALYAVTDRGVLWSWNQGATWAARGTGIDAADLRVLRADVAGRFYTAGFGGVFRSDDGGRRWEAANRGLTDRRVRTLALDPTTPRVLYAGTVGGGVFRTADGGASWRPFNEGLGPSTVLSVLAASDGGLFAGTIGGVYRRAPDAAAWERTRAGAPRLTITFIAEHPRRPGWLYVGTGGQLFVSEDHGHRWQSVLASEVDGHAAIRAAGHSHDERR
ncbi:MAG: hypothetical protein HY216_00560 [Candidatus Rokubacteria bacterium]|nr:hypothetical protein [Candidatus Rokubacteria bacterium]